ncbi:MAG TPA: hypothetical protein VEC57_09675 [Candidatus Limnocylindrales bacterium]|nr:hypothetical protein [Candidatus Limnocylindrales bacterium]
MKIDKSSWLSLTVGLALTAGVANAQTIVTTSPGATYTGVVSEINPTANTIILKSESAPAPVTYTYTPQTVFVDATGNTVSYEAIRNVPVTVEYAEQGGRTVVTRVVATRPAGAAVVAPPPPPGPAVIERKTVTRTEEIDD